MAKLATMRRLPWRDRRLLVHAAMLVSLLVLALRVFGFRRVHAFLSRLLTPDDQSCAVSLDEGSASTRVLEIARLVEMASRHTPLSNTCLHRSLTLWWLLKRRGFDGRLQFGVRKQDGRFEAHAWVEYDGASVNDQQVNERDYVRFSLMPLKNDA